MSDEANKPEWVAPQRFELSARQTHGGFQPDQFEIQSGPSLSCYPDAGTTSPTGS